ncbi:uncharacterized protein MONOS_12903 [Monocercomonoides exilis]|uniref:uncharacterized protein n=1 Tax=Monocercomonoides exilis TaxID=2049356 RepID=UPI003559BC86|nr:hypothetical protein MONOS_12903 [Monocercomonoides exilis]
MLCDDGTYMPPTNEMNEIASELEIIGGCGAEIHPVNVIYRISPILNPNYQTPMHIYNINGTSLCLIRDPRTTHITPLTLCLKKFTASDIFSSNLSQKTFFMKLGDSIMRRFKRGFSTTLTSFGVRGTGKTSTICYETIFNEIFDLCEKVIKKGSIFSNHTPSYLSSTSQATLPKSTSYCFSGTYLPFKTTDEFTAIFSKSIFPIDGKLQPDSFMLNVKSEPFSVLTMIDMPSSSPCVSKDLSSERKMLSRHILSFNESIKRISSISKPTATYSETSLFTRSRDSVFTSLLLPLIFHNTKSTFIMHLPSTCIIHRINSYSELLTPQHSLSSTENMLQRELQVEHSLLNEKDQPEPKIGGEELKEMQKTKIFECYPFHVQCEQSAQSQNIHSCCILSQLPSVDPTENSSSLKTDSVSRLSIKQEYLSCISVIQTGESLCNIKVISQPSKLCLWDCCSFEEEDRNDEHLKQSIFMNKQTNDNYKLVEYIVSKRSAVLSYLRKAHSGNGVVWLNHVRLTPDELKASQPPQKMSERIREWFSLGYSLAPLLQLASGPVFLKGLSQLIVEYTYHNSNFASQGLQSLMAKDKSQTGSVQLSLNEEYKGTLLKTSFGIYFERLQTPTVPDFLDYNRVVCSLCTIMEQIYKKFLDESWFRTSAAAASNALVEAIKTVDAQFKSEFFGMLSREITSLAMMHLKKQVSSFEDLVASFDTQLPKMISGTGDEDENSQEILEHSEEKATSSSVPSESLNNSQCQNEDNLPVGQENITSEASIKINE